MFETILVATDGSETAEEAVECAFGLAEEYGATLHAIFVVDTRLYGEPALSSTEQVVEEVEDRGNSLLQQLAERAAGLGLDLTTRCSLGNPSEEIVRYGESIDAALLVLGYKGQTGQTSDRVGSVAERVVRATDRSVLLV
jgi:nucleotide-binding universal stress UspA family protein